VLKTPAFQVQDPTVLEKASRDVTGWISQASDRHAVVAQSRRCSTSARDPDGQINSRFSLFRIDAQGSSAGKSGSGLANGATAGAWMRAIVDVAGRVPEISQAHLQTPWVLQASTGLSIGRRRLRTTRLDARQTRNGRARCLWWLNSNGGPASKQAMAETRHNPDRNGSNSNARRCLWTSGVLRLAAGSSCSWEPSNGRRPLCSGDQEGGDGFNATVLIGRYVRVRSFGESGDGRRVESKRGVAVDDGTAESQTDSKGVIP
jgi:hypothetical protein